jgi:hypothetical protein
MILVSPGENFTCQSRGIPASVRANSADVVQNKAFVSQLAVKYTRMSHYYSAISMLYKVKPNLNHAVNSFGTRLFAR